jgi:cytochrome oxidase Cu insertion factor (SCO1/SenC/PrrC family)
LTVLESKCKQSCPVIASDIAGAWKLLSSSDRSNAVAVAISSNPIDDTRGSIRTFLERRHAAGVIRYLTGPVPVMRSVWRRLYVLSSLNSGSADVHSAPVRIYNRDLTWVATQGAGVDLSPANLAHDVRVALAQR